MRRSRWLCSVRPARRRDRCARDVVRVLCLWFTLWVWMPAAAAQDRTFVDASIPAEAAAAIAASDWEQVATLLEPLARADEPGEPVHYWYGVALYHQGHCTFSLHHLNAALKLRPRSRGTAHHIARVALAHSIVAEPKDLKPALAAFPDDALVLTAAGAVEHEQWARRYKPGRDDTVAWTHLDQARDYLRRAIAQDGSNVPARLEMAETLKKLERWDEAIRHLVIVDRLEPLGPEAYAMLGELYTEKGDHSAAADAYQVAMEVAPAVTQGVQWPHAEALLNAGRSEEAVEAFRDIFNGDVVQRRVRLMLGRAAYDAGDYTLALHCFRESHKVDHSADALVWSARCAYDMGQDELAVKLVNQAIEMGKARDGEDFHAPEDWSFVRGRALWQLGDKKAATEDLDRAARLAAENHEYVTWALFAFRKLNDPYGVLRVARAYGNAADPWEAMEIVRQVQKIWAWFPPRKDFRGTRYPRGLGEEISRAIADLYDEMNQTLSAAMMCKSAGHHGKGRMVYVWTSWVRFRAGMIADAELMFDRLARNGTTDATKQKGHGGLALIGLMRRDPNAIRTHAKVIQDKWQKPVATTLLKRADVLSGREGAVEALDAFDLLGVHGYSLSGRRFERGFYVQALLPGSPLAQATPPVRPKDVVIRVGKRHLCTLESIDSLRQEPVPRGETTILVRRGDRTFEVTVDFAAARDAIAEERANEEEPTS